MELVNYVNDVAQPARQVLMTYDANGNYQAAYSYGLERIKVDFLDQSRPDSQEPLYYLYDGLGSVSQLMMPAGNVRAGFNYDPFGDPVTGGHLPIDNYNVLYNPFGYTGQQHDQETGFVYLRARYYDPSVGRFISRDPRPADSLNPQTLNRYAYVVNNPMRSLDPLGLCIDAGTMNGTTGSTQVSTLSQNDNTPPVVPGAAAATSKLSFGAGISVSESTDVGAYTVGAGQTGSAGAGVFHGSSGFSAGGYASWGGFAGGPGYGWASPSGTNHFAAGAYGGGGLDVFITNASKVSDLSGSFKTYSFNAGWKTRVLSIQLSIGSNGTWVFSYGGPLGPYTTGVGFGISFSEYNTYTAVTP